MRYPYQEIEPGKVAPIIDIRLFGRGRLYRFEAYVDSGADYSLFEEQVARLIGIKLKEGREIPLTVGDGDRMKAYLHRIPVLFSGEKFFAPICFSSQLGSGFNLLGRAGFFRKFRICFHEREGFLSVVKEGKDYL